jgi:hypothetical protein
LKTVKLLLALFASSLLAFAAPPELLESKRIWDAAPHSAFTDLARWNDAWWCTFRESAGHVGGDGKIRILTSRDGVAWESAALLTEEGIDLRDPKFSVTPDGRLMLTLGGSLYRGGTKLLGRQSRVSFSKDGRDWSTPQKVLTEGDWLWRVTWHSGTAYGVSYRNDPPAATSADSLGATKDWTLALYKSIDGLAWDRVAPLPVPDHPNETTLRFRPDGECLALVRREAGDKQAWLGRAKAPYTDWTWQPTGRFIGGPNFLISSAGTLLACGRVLQPGGPKTAFGPLESGVWNPTLTFPSGGDTSYAGLVEHEGAIWVSYYSSHEAKKSAIYLAKVRP